MDSPALTAVDRLRKLIPALDDGDADQQWLAGGLARYLSDAERGLSLELALDLSPAPGQAAWWTQEAAQARDAVLCEMAMRFWPDLLPGAQARHIERLALRYSAAGWLRDRDRADMPERLIGTEAEWLWRACKSGAAMPIKRRQIETILTAEKQDAAA